MELVRLLYISRSCIDAESAEMRNIGAVSQARNAAQGVTGYLYYDDDAFVQVLEGPAKAVDHVFAKIDTDPRHQDIRVLEHCGLDQRRFGDWAMGLYNGSLYSGLLRLAFGQRFIATITTEDAKLLEQFLFDLSQGRDSKYQVEIS